MQLFLLHFAGGNCYSYDFLRKKIGSYTFKTYALELPGRGKRFGEDLITDKIEAIEDYVSQICKLRNAEPYIIYGHSMGATLGLSVTKRMEEKGDAPVQLIVSGNAGPGAKEKDENGKIIEKEKRYLLPDNDFQDVLRELGGVPEEVLTNEELYEFFNPIIRADFQILEEKEGIEEEMIIKTPIHAIMGDQEKTSDQIENWKQFTISSFKNNILPGHHFFIYNQTKEIVNIIARYNKITMY
ncbi:thioesterase II family protein [Aquimarina rhabdastrellae]